MKIDTDELWDKYSQRIDGDIDSLQYFADRDVVIKEDFYKCLIALTEQLKQHEAEKADLQKQVKLLTDCVIEAVKILKKCDYKLPTPPIK
jgi:hypothetical protein